jgi:tRNA A-37 threonylcarbamoyl transferase component Bud32
MRGIPAGYVLWRAGNLRAVLRQGLEDDLLRSGLDHPEALTAGLPRGRVARIALPDGDVVVRAYRRGGLLGRSRVRYLTVGRFRRELRVTLQARQRGLRIPEPLGFAARRMALGWRGWAAFRAVPGGRDLREVLAGLADPEAAETLLARVFREVRQAHDRGLRHRDLNLGNLLLDDHHPPGVWILDLDRVHLGAPRSPRGRFAEISRLDRSLEKVFGERLLGRSARDRLILGYAGDRPDLQATFRGRLGAHIRRLRRHRILWRILARGQTRSGLNP